MSHYLFLTGIVTYCIGKNVLSQISENAKRKQALPLLYKDYCKCLEVKGFHMKYDDMNSDFHTHFGQILQNKDVHELESCKKEYFHFIQAYINYKNSTF
jgi:hypothetical protein